MLFAFGTVIGVYLKDYLVLGPTEETRLVVTYEPSCTEAVLHGDVCHLYVHGDPTIFKTAR